MLRFSKFFYWIFITLIICSCKHEKESSESQVSWTDKKPLSIPKNVRFQQYEKGNLVLNHSFETGKYFYEDSLIGSFDIKGWKKVGGNVEWISAIGDSSLYSEVSKGTHSVKIHREKFNEVDELGDGIISDYIKVIPGNYSFSLDIKLHNVVSNLRRFGLKLYDAVNIRLFFYDKNKLPIEASSYNSSTKSTIDKSFKSYTFSNFRDIKDFNWGKVIGKSFNHPQLEGTIPNQAKYVKIFLGLKGKGVMWIDNVNFSYSKFNFTPLEKLEPYFDSTFTKTDLLIPAPHYIEKLGAIKYFGDTTISAPLIVIPSQPKQEVRHAAELLKRKMNSIFNKLLATEKQDYVKIIFELNDQIIGSDALIFSIGPSVLFKINKQGLPLSKLEGIEQAYFIKNISDISNVIYIYGREPIANFYAVATLIQLFEENEFNYHNATIIDYPDFVKRSCFLRGVPNELIKDDIKYLKLLKCNSLYINFNEEKIDLKGLRYLCKKNFINLSLGYFTESYVAHDIEKDEFGREIHYRYNYGTQTISRLKKDITRGLKLGVKNYLILGTELNSFHSKNSTYYLLKGNNKDRFFSVQNADIFILKTIDSWLGKYYPGTKLEFLPPYFTSESINISNGLGEQYFQDIAYQLPERINILWTGNTNNSFFIDMADNFYFKNLCGKDPVFLDNSFLIDSISICYADKINCPGIVRKQNLFQPYNVVLPENFHLYNKGKQMIINKFLFNEIDKIRFATVADYLWNTKSYDPDFSLWKILVSTFGKKGATELILFNNDFYFLYDLYYKMVKEKLKGKYVKQAEKVILDLNARFEILIGEIENENFLEELEIKKDKIIEMYQSLTFDQ